MGPQASLHGLIDTLPGLIWTALPDGRVDFLNRRWSEFTGLPVDKGLGTGWQTIIHRADLSALLKQWYAAIDAGAACDAQVRLRRSDGEYRWFQFRASPMFDATGTIVRWCGLNTDIDGCRHADAPTQDESEMRGLIDRLPASITVANEKGEHIYTSSWGLTRSEAPQAVLRGLGFITDIHPDEQEWVAAEWLRCVATGQTMEHEHRLKRADGVYRWLHVRVAPFHDAQGRIVRWYGVLTDIDDQRKAEEALRQSEQRFRTLVEMIPAQVSRWRADGVRDFFNQRVVDYCGHQSDQGMDVHPEDWEARLMKCLTSLKTGNPMESTHRLRRSDGQYRWFYERVEPMRDEGGNVVCWYAVSVDIHDSREMDDALRSTKDRLNAATQAAAIAELSASIAHEINQPLTCVIINATTGLEMLASDPPNLRGARETVRRTIRDGNRAADVVMRLRALFANTDTQTEWVNLNEVAEEVIALTRSDLQRTGVVLHTRLSSNSSFVRGDRIQFQQVILNLLRNAAEAMEGVNDRPRRLTVGTDHEIDGHVHLFVHDSGHEINPDILEHVFEAFYTTKTSGMGIGLSVSRSIIEKHGGRMWAAVNPGPGMTFHFSLPGGKRH